MLLLRLIFNHDQDLSEKTPEFCSAQFLFTYLKIGLFFKNMNFIRQNLFHLLTKAALMYL